VKIVVILLFVAILASLARRCFPGDDHGESKRTVKALGCASDCR